MRHGYFFQERFRQQDQPAVSERGTDQSIAIRLECGGDPFSRERIRHAAFVACHSPIRIAPTWIAPTWMARAVALRLVTHMHRGGRLRGRCRRSLWRQLIGHLAG